jgi:uncharacterized protein (TIGR00369 family)
VKVLPGEVEIQIPYRADLAQQNGFMHAGIVTSIVDTACGYAALSLMATGVDVLTVEYKVNFVSPATGHTLIARGKVIRPGRTLTVCAGDVVTVSDQGEKLVATMLATMMAIRDRADFANVDK